jgi:hypothetical protein
MRKTIMIKPREFFLLLSTVFLLGVLPAQAAEPQQPSTQPTSDEELVKQTQNPVAGASGDDEMKRFLQEVPPKDGSASG